MPDQIDQPSKGQKIARVMLLAAAASAGLSLIGIAIFDRSRSINNGVVIAAGVFFAFLALSSLYEFGSNLKQACVQGINAQNQSTIR